MTMNHNAFVFEYERFESELRPILLDALEAQDVAAIRRWIATNRDALVDPYEGKKLPDGWEATMPDHRAQTYCDFALTKFYNPTHSVGLDEDWEALGELLEQSGSSEAIILGTPLGSEDGRLFDPGGCGSYFQTRDEVRANSSEVENLQARSPMLRSRLAPIAEMLQTAVKAQQGMYITF
jgi:hypothetical protein